MKVKSLLYWMQRNKDISIWLCLQYMSSFYNGEWLRLINKWCFCVCALTLFLSSVLATRAGTKTECTPPLSQVPSIMTGKVIDYTPHWADRAGGAAHRGREVQRGAGSGSVTQDIHSHTLLNHASICTSSTFHVKGIRMENGKMSELKFKN